VRKPLLLNSFNPLLSECISERQAAAFNISSKGHRTATDAGLDSNPRASNFAALCVLVGAGGILRLAFPIGSFGVGTFLYLRYPVLYIGFTWWRFLTPCRRLIDYQSGWDMV